MSSVEGPFGPGFRRCGEEEKRRWYFRSTNALWNLNRVAGLRITDSFGIRRGLRTSVVSPSRKRSSEVRFRGALSGSITDQQLVFEQQRLCGDGTYTTWAKKLHEGDEQVDGENEGFAYGTNDTMPAVLRKTARHRRRASYYEFATHTTKCLYASARGAPSDHQLSPELGISPNMRLPLRCLFFGFNKLRQVLRHCHPPYTGR